MSSITINGDTSGSVILQAPAVSGSTTLTLPTTTGTLVTSNAMPTGSVVQVVNATYSTETSRSSSTYADTGLTASITPSSSSNNILVFVNLSGMLKQTNDTSIGAKLVRNSTDILVFEGSGAGNAATTIDTAGSSSTCYLDSPATTSSTTYKVQFRSNSNNASVTINANAGGSALTTSTITLMEIKG